MRITYHRVQANISGGGVVNQGVYVFFTSRWKKSEYEL